MDKEYLKEHNLMKAHEQFMRLAEGYLSTPSVLGEEGDEEENAQAQPPQGPGPESGAPEAPMGGPDGGQQPPMDDGVPDGGMPGPQDGPSDQPMGEEPPMNGANGEMAPMGEEPPMGDPGDDLEPQEDDEVLDVEDLTNAQEKLNSKQNSLGHDLGQLDNRIDTLLGAIEKMKDVITNNNQEIVNLKQELERRVPDEKEKLDLRSLDNGPFNVKPSDYFDKLNKEGRYEVNTEPKEHILRQKDIEDYNPSEIEKSLDDDLDQSMEKIFKDFR